MPLKKTNLACIFEFNLSCCHSEEGKRTVTEEKYKQSIHRLIAKGYMKIISILQPKNVRKINKIRKANHYKVNSCGTTTVSWIYSNQMLPAVHLNLLSNFWFVSTGEKRNFCWNQIIIDRKYQQRKYTENIFMTSLELVFLLVTLF